MNWRKRIGIILVALSFVLYGMILLLPFVPLATSLKLSAAPVLAVLGELAFWSGSVFLGKEIILRYKRYLDPRNWCADK